MKIINYVPIILAVFMYGGATYLTLDLYLSIADGISIEESISLPLSGNLAGYLFLGGSILLIGYFIIEVMRNK